jgi:phage-related protein
MPKKAVFVGSSRDDLRGFPKDVRNDMAYQIYRVQSGLDPNDWRPMATVGSGVRELRVRGSDREYRGMYITNIGDAVYVLHVFIKGSQKTPKKELEIAKKRLGIIRGQQKCRL